ncbi:AAA family ATPase [Streptomyces sp. NPDC097727]|uniref:AAA family ATPase n=1 Tax=Streptomyces sp. NPDC097727 TaxID=3366092 RepID=UPI0038182698
MTGRLGGLSLGMAQRLGIAQALLGNPPVLILDEPANGLDPHSIRWLRDLLRELAAEGRAVLVSSHLLTEMEHMADHIVVMARGRVLTEASIANVRERIGSRVNVQTPRTEELVLLARGKGAAVEPVGRGQVRITGLDRFAVGDLAAAHGIALHWLDEQAQSLEEFCLSVAEEEFKVG